MRVTGVIRFFSTSSVGHYKKVTFYFEIKRCEENKRNKSVITPCTLRYSLCLQIYLFLPFFFKSISTQNIIEQLFSLQRVVEYEPNTDIPNACRDILVLYVSDTWIRITWMIYILFCAWPPGILLCDTDSERSWHGKLIVIEVDMDNYTILKCINNHFTETFFIYEITNWLIIESMMNLVYFH